MNLLLIEDQPDFVQRVCETARGSDITIITQKGTPLDDEPKEGTPIEEQLRDILSTLDQKNTIDLVLLDTDLSRFHKAWFSQSVFRQTLQELGIPVCRYSKGASTTRIKRFRELRRLAIEGASAIWVPSAKLAEADLSSVISWLRAVHKGFATLSEALSAHGPVKRLGPAGTLAAILNKAGLQADLLGYTSQNFFFFGPELHEDADATEHANRLWATRLGYWLFNYILAFPGPILNATAAAAYLNLQKESFATDAVQKLIAGCKYDGPFSNVEPYFWRSELTSILERSGGDIQQASELIGSQLKRVVADPLGVAFMCLLTDEPISEEEASPSLDWIPSGAQLARIRSDELEQIDPMLSA